MCAAHRCVAAMPSSRGLPPTTPLAILCTRHVVQHCIYTHNLSKATTLDACMQPDCSALAFCPVERVLTGNIGVCGVLTQTATLWLPLKMWCMCGSFATASHASWPVLQQVLVLAAQQRPSYSGKAGSKCST